MDIKERGVTLDGPKPGWGEMIIRDQDEVSARWRQAFAVLGFCRMAETLVAGEVHSKRHGAEWAKASMDAAWQGLIDRAFAERAHPIKELLEPADALAKRETQSFVAYVLEHQI